MAKPTTILINKLREAASRIESGADYSWGHVGKCNCGHLVQTVTTFNQSEIYQKAREQTLDEWTEYANDYCDSSGASMDLVIDALFAIGVEVSDIHHLEYLSDRTVLAALPGGFRYLQKSNPRDVSLYMRTWAGVLEMEHYNNKKVLSPETIQSFTGTTSTYAFPEVVPDTKACPSQ